MSFATIFDARRTGNGNARIGGNAMARSSTRDEHDDTPALQADGHRARLTNPEFAALAVILLAAVALRITIPYHNVFTPAGVHFMGADPWYHVRATEYAVANFPHALQWDPYALAPDGQYVPMAPGLDWMSAGVALALGGGSPSPTLVHAVCAWLPPLLGLATIIAVYALARMLFDRTAALLAAAMCATLPGPFLTRTLLGYADHHAAEVCFSALAFTAVIFAIRQMCALRSAPAAPRAWATAKRVALPSAIAGVFLGAYLLCWFAGSFLVFILFCGLLLALVGDFLARKPTAPHLAVILPTFLIALAMVAPLHARPGFLLQIASLVGGAAALSLCIAVATAARRLKLPTVAGVVAMIVLGALAVVAARFAAPAVFHSIAHWVGGFLVNPGAHTVDEATSILEQNGRLSLQPLFSFFTTNAGFAIAGLAGLLFAVLRYRRPDRGVFFAWSLIMMLALLKQRRFSYYAAVNMAVLAAFTGVWIARTLADALPAWPRRDRLRRATPAILVLLLTVGPNLWLAVAAARRQTGPTHDWMAALHWMREHTPPPFDDANHFTADYRAAGGHALANYGVMSWWDYGYWIVQIARRAPVANPTQAGAPVAARFLLATDEADAAAIMHQCNARYVVVDRMLPLWKSETGGQPVGKFPHIPFWAGAKTSRYFQHVRMRKRDGRHELATIYFPDYYRTMCVRLFLFGGDAASPTEPAWVLKLGDGDGATPPLVESIRRCATYDEAVAFRDAHPADGWRIAGLSPHRSCVPIEPLHRFRPIYNAPTSAAKRDETPIPAVRMFELTDAAPAD